jgi:glycosyltransferase involved in cell wall biosynthesis
LGVSPENVHTVYLGCDPAWGPITPGEKKAARDRLTCRDGRPTVLFVGALSHDQNKGLDTLLSAWRILCSRPNWDADLVVAGGGNGLASWEQRVRSAGLERRVRFLGFTDRIRDVLAAADLLVSPVRYEAYGLNVQEAICRGVPAVVSKNAGIAERYPSVLVDKLLPDPSNAYDLMTKLLSWRGTMELWKESFSSFGNSLRKYAWTDMARNIVSIIDVKSEPEVLLSL